jgi:phosphoglycerate dehydrogenase-like enzyme
VVDVEALAKAVQSETRQRRDPVFPEEPAATNTVYSPLTGASDVILTPHIGSTREAQQHRKTIILGALISFL